MGHCVEALVLTPEAASAAASEGALVTLVQLDSANLSLLPLTDELFDSLKERYPEAAAEPYAEFWKFSGAAMEWVKRLSEHGKVAYVETDYFGGAGTQAAAVWQGGELKVPPSKAENSINAALRELGVKVSFGKHDEFEAAGLHRHRDNDDWLEEATVRG